MKKINLFDTLKSKGVTVEDGEKKMLDEMSTEINTAMEDARKGLITAEDAQKKVDDAIKALPSEFSAKSVKVGEGDTAKSIEDIMREQGKVISDLQKQFSGEGGSADSNSTRSQIVAWQTENKEAFEAIKSGKRTDLTPLTIKAPVTMTVAGSLGGSAYLPNVQVLPGVNDLVRNQPVFRRYFAAGRKASSPTIVWVNKTNKQGNAQFIGEGVTKPLASFELSTETSSAKKVAEAMKVSTEMLQDIDYMESLIENELRYEVDMAVDAAVLTGNGTGANLRGVTTYASAYALTTVKTTTPNIADVALAAVTQLKTLNFTPNLIFLNTIDYANMMLTKDSQGRYVNAEGIKVALPTIVETNNIPVGKILVVDSSKYQVYPYVGYTVAWGWENDDFRKNLVTAIGEERLHAFLSANNAGAVLYDNIATIKTAITAA